MEALHIDRAKWATGRLRRVKRDGDNYLRSSRDGRCCALGFYALNVLKLRPKTITDRSSLRAVIHQLGNEPDGRFSCGSEATITGANDETKLPAKDRETQLKTLFRDVLDVELTFSGRLAR